MPPFLSHLVLLGVLVLPTVRADGPSVSTSQQTTSMMVVSSVSTTLGSGNGSKTLTPEDHRSPTAATTLLYNNNTGGGSHGNQTHKNTMVGDEDKTTFMAVTSNTTAVTMTMTSANVTASQSQAGVSSSSTVTTAATLNSTPVPGRNAEKISYVILFFILLAILCLGVLLYFLRKKSRRYSFDLQRPGYDHETPLTCIDQPGTFEPTREYASTDGIDDDHQGPVANGSAGSAMAPEGNGSTEESGGEKPDDGDANSFNNLCSSEITLTPPTKRVGFSLDLDLNDRQSDQSDTGEDQKNANNNNSAVGNSPGPPGFTFDPVGPFGVFTEINLDM